jgi:hypothetical protein
MTPKQERTHNLTIQFVDLLIESGSSVREHLEVINDITKKLKFCITTGQSIEQFKMKL